ncbi:nitric oxide synthase-related [Holotrichia oblita]|uniref:Nitric oxide synthase-related n=1 Tax=Holotrichia oblita TaxID=644536 RepID=A0ACB9T5W1_HOLOL|nr:nitric oxide synthase-related [Holotrichia oblita]
MNNRLEDVRQVQVFDCRYVTTTSGMFEALCNHIKYSTNKGNIRSAITIFPQRTDAKHDFRVWNSQLVGYAGYKQADGTVLGDPLSVEFTEVCMKLGWRGAGTRFDILPLVLSANGHDPDYFDIPAELILEVNLSHPDYDWFEELGLKWYTLPAVSNMMFDCGGIQFTAAPFNGWAVKFTSKLFGRALSRRIKATVLYATETGKSEGFAKKLGEIFGHAFNAQVYCMSDYDISNIEHEALLLVVTSTFGNGDPPKMARFAVFALGSSAYPNFCAFGQYVDNLLLELGGERLLKMACGDEMCGQEQAFKKWAPEIFRVACETFCLDDDDALMEATITLQTENLTQTTVKFVEAKPMDEVTSILKSHNKKISLCKLLKRNNLHGENAMRATLKLELESNLHYNPGDHVGVYPKNKPELVDKILERLKGVDDLDAPMELQILKETQTSNGVVKQWCPHEKIPARSVRELFSRFLDIATPPSSNLLQQFAAIATDEEDQKSNRINTKIDDNFDERWRRTISDGIIDLRYSSKQEWNIPLNDQKLKDEQDSAAYEDWRHWRYPNLLEVLEEFPSVNPYAPLLVAQLSLLQPRFYSISSSRAIYPNQIHLTVAVVTYRTQDGEGPVHYGVASNYLQDVPVGEEVALFVRSAPSFYLPTDPTRPIVLVGPGTGIAPFAAFWQQRKAQAAAQTRLGKCWLFFGCRQKELDLYSKEKQLMVENKIIDRNFLALSREKGIKKTYVQDLLLKEAAELFKMIVLDKGHFYVCGDVTMADHVYQTLKTILQKYGNMTDEQVEKFMLTMRDENRYHEDIFGITLRTAEVHNRSRESARIRMASEP